MPFYAMQRTRSLYLAKKKWQQNRSFKPISRKKWRKLSINERVELVQTIMKVELEEKKYRFPCEIRVYSGQIDEDDLWVQIDAKNLRILWNSAAVNVFSLRKILKKLILAIQQYQYYCSFEMKEKQILNRFPKKRASEQMLYWKSMMYEKMAYTKDVTPYDIITGQYARARSAWYCSG